MSIENKNLTPTEKSPEIEALLTKTVGISRQDAMTQHICTFCKGEAKEFRDEASVKEYTISGLCQECQDKTFGR